MDILGEGEDAGSNSGPHIDRRTSRLLELLAKLEDEQPEAHSAVLMLMESLVYKK